MAGGYGIRPYVKNYRGGVFKVVGEHSICSRIRKTISYARGLVCTLAKYKTHPLLKVFEGFRGLFTKSPLIGFGTKSQWGLG